MPIVSPQHNVTAHEQGRDENTSFPLFTRAAIQGTLVTRWKPILSARLYLDHSSLRTGVWLIYLSIPLKGHIFCREHRGCSGCISEQKAIYCSPPGPCATSAVRSFGIPPRLHLPLSLYFKPPLPLHLDANPSFYPVNASLPLT